MTRQVGDKIVLRDIEYSIERASGSPLFDPRQYGLKPVMASTACWSGYSVSYSIVHDRLVLTSLAVYLESGAPTINGITPTKCPSSFDFSDQYNNLNLPVRFSGGLLIARDYLGFKLDLGNSLYDMGDPPPWHYEQLFELSLEWGCLVRETDLSGRMQQFRAAFAAQLNRTGDRSYPSLNREFKHLYEDL